MTTTWIYLSDLMALPDLPDRIALEKKDYGMVNLRHAKQPRVEPALSAGFYKRLIDGRIYVVEVSSRRPNGESHPAWIYRPQIRVRASKEYRQEMVRELRRIDKEPPEATFKSFGELMSYLDDADGEPVRCAECDCANPPDGCNWIKRADT